MSNRLILILEPIQAKTFLSTDSEMGFTEIVQLHANIKISINALDTNIHTHGIFFFHRHSIPVYVYVNEINRICLERDCDSNT